MQPTSHQLRRLVTIVIAWTLWPVNALATQGHAGIEGVWVHQFAHVFFLFSMGLLIFWLRQADLVKAPGWRYIQYAAVFFILWNADAFLVHYLDEQRLAVTVTTISDWHVHIEASGGGNWLSILYYLAKLDHLLCVPSHGLPDDRPAPHARGQPACPTQWGNASMTVTAFPIWFVDVVGSVLMIIFSFISLAYCLRLRKKDTANIIINYLLWVCVALAVFAISRSAGHLLKQLLLITDRQHLWTSIQPFSGAVNTFTFIVVASVTLFFERTWAIYGTILKDRQALQTAHEELIF